VHKARVMWQHVQMVESYTCLCVCMHVCVLRKMTYKDKPSYASSPPCTKRVKAVDKRLQVAGSVSISLQYVYVYVCMYIHICM